MANTYKKPKRAINVVTIKGYSTSAEDMPNDPNASNAYRAFQAHETVEIKTSDTETFLIPFHAIAEFQSFLDTTALTKKDPYCDDEGASGEKIEMAITYSQQDGEYSAVGYVPQTGSKSLEVDNTYKVTITGSNGETAEIIGTAMEVQGQGGGTAIAVSGPSGTFGMTDGTWMLGLIVPSDGYFGDSVTITITEGGDSGDNPK